MRLIVENRFALFGLVALALVAMLGIAYVVRPVHVVLGESEPGTIRPDHSVRVCPAPHEGADDAESSIRAFAPRVDRDDEGSLRAGPIPAVRGTDEDAAADDEEAEDTEDTEDADEAEGESDADGPDGSDDGAEGADGRTLGEELTEPGLLWNTDTGAETDPVALHAEGALASGLDASQVTVTDDGVTEVRCLEPSIGTWFALPGGSDPEDVAVDSLTAHLANPEDSRATVSVDVFTTEGPSYSSESRGIALAAGESTELDLTDLVANSGAIGVHVRTSTGRVGAALLAEHSSGATDWVPPTTGPDVEHVIPGALGGDGTRRLYVAAPGDEPAEVRVHVVGSGDAEEEGTEEEEAEGEPEETVGTAGDPLVLNVAPAASAWLTLETALAGEPGTVVVESDVPVVAGVVAEIEDSGGDVVETAYSAAVEPLAFPHDTTAVLANVPEDVETQLVLGAVDADVSVIATPIGDDGTQGDAVKITVGAGTTRMFGTEDDAWERPPGTDPEDAYAVRLELLDESAGPVHAARVLRSGLSLSVVPVHPAPIRVELPVVRDTMVGVVP
ncbi:hypothetical protein DFP74_0974 [Nocardiopsis sp. Huas11]|uniref:DUF5719 family protein n=1 Tax=Nocardiopsis sp. Huas11 TaxID=2183912 RepID=UPI000EADE5CB|nr:DUF5719 family protein [Nocardiopsis sp. Huas11]RKS05379.1 hypothetical protein DFP74_0974 [Nocardiopsis sp. Huas11]